MKKENLSKWSEWVPYMFYGTCAGIRINGLAIYYRTKDRNVQVKLYNNAFRAKARCSPYDRFDVYKGIAVALSRVVIKAGCSSIEQFKSECDVECKKRCEREFYDRVATHP